MFCSTIIATIGRETLDRAVYSVLNQNFPADEYEVIVVNDSGRPLAIADWQRSTQVRIIHTNKRTQSVARNVGAAVAFGDYVHFLDDDDWILSGALANLSDLAYRMPAAAWLYGGTRLLDRHERELFELHHGLTGNAFVQILAGEWIPLAASIIRCQAFFEVGGFNPRLPVSEDMDLCRRITLKGDVAGTSQVVAVHCIGNEGSSSPRSRDDEFSQRAREVVLSETGAFARLLDSARGAFWLGRVCRAFLTSALWNMQHGRLFSSLGRIAFGAGSMALSVRYYGSPDFWKALLRRYQSQTFTAGMAGAGMVPGTPESIVHR